ncbi:MAG: hypothetical protein PWQ37_2894 [Candidatus Petromonas sp.]|jgi:hypothetical protein|nr:hypothetical protein [Candidatus Petromonas sp.]
MQYAISSTIYNTYKNHRDDVKYSKVKISEGIYGEKNVQYKLNFLKNVFGKYKFLHSGKKFF